MGDHVGLGWRGELAAGIFEHFDEIDALEVIAEDWMDAPRREQDALRALARAKPVTLHGVAMGLASVHAVERRRLDRMARLVDRVGPEGWSEHLAFVRAGGHEVGHLAAPPRTPANVEGALRNLELAARVVGTGPALENVATLIDPPASTLDEPGWVRAIVAPCRVPMLLDLHNLHANAVNFGRAPEDLLDAMPLDRVRYVHLSGGRWLREGLTRPRLLDDHLHDVPDEVFGLLRRLAARAPQPLTVIVERDGEYPAFDLLLGQLRNAREALEEGRRAAAIEKAAA